MLKLSPLFLLALLISCQLPLKVEREGSSTVIPECGVLKEVVVGETADAESPLEQTKNSSLLSWFRTNRSVAELSEWRKLSSKASVEPRLTELLQDPSHYQQADFKKGIVRQGNVFLLDERFSSTILGDIQIGTSKEEVLKTFGLPTCQGAGTIFYKTDSFYVAFYGDTRVERATISPAPRVDYPPRFLEDLKRDLDKESKGTDLVEFLEQHPKWKPFFPEQSHIHGGGWHLFSPAGVEITSFKQHLITVGNNYSGEISNTASTPEGFNIRYMDKDFVIEEMARVLREHKELEVLFAQEGKRSPSGRWISVYERITSDHHYFTIRDSAREIPDFRIDMDAGDYAWITDDYILALDFPYESPFLLRVTPDESQREKTAVDVLASLGLGPVGEEPLFQGWQLESVSDKDFTLKSDDNRLTVRFSRTKGGDLELSSRGIRPKQ